MAILPWSVSVNQIPAGPKVSEGPEGYLAPQMRGCSILPVIRRIGKEFQGNNLSAARRTRESPANPCNRQENCCNLWLSRRSYVQESEGSSACDVSEGSRAGKGTDRPDHRRRNQSFPRADSPLRADGVSLHPHHAAQRPGSGGRRAGGDDQRLPPPERFSRRGQVQHLAGNYCRERSAAAAPQNQGGPDAIAG